MLLYVVGFYVYYTFPKVFSFGYSVYTACYASLVLAYFGLLEFAPLCSPPSPSPHFNPPLGSTVYAPDLEQHLDGAHPPLS